MVGVALALLGPAIVSGTLAVDLVGAGKWDSLGPAQQLAIFVGAAAFVVGLSLLPLGNRPA
jgi:lipopolysaccharide export LptBFGC system permease protein LptF